MNGRRLLVLLLVAGTVSGGCFLNRIRPVGEPGEVRKSDLPELRRLEGDRVRSHLQPDAIPAIDDPRFVAAGEADFMAPEERVLGVVHDGVAKAYSLWHLDRHEIVNDRIGRYPIAVTW